MPRPTTTAEAAAKKPRGKKAAEAEPASTVMGYKGFDANLSCRDYQFAIGETFTHTGKVKACSSGFHFCENPLDVWSCYAPNGLNRFARVHGGGDIARHASDSKIAAGTLMIETEVIRADERPIGFDPNCVGCIHNATRPCARCTECFLYDGGFCGNIYPFREIAAGYGATLDGERVCEHDAAILRGPEWRDAA